MQRWEASPEARATACSDLLVSVIAVAVELHLRQALGSGIQGDGAGLGEEDLRLYKAMKRWHNEVGDMLAYANDVSRRR